jgi:hypothetical protein
MRAIFELEFGKQQLRMQAEGIYLGEIAFRAGQGCPESEFPRFVQRSIVLLVSLIYPIADLRQFVADTGRLARPVWPTPSDHRDFVRFIGSRQERIHEGLEDWVGEGLHIDARRGIRFGASSDPATSSNLPRPFIGAYRRLFFDGIAVAKLELGLTDDQKTRKVDHPDDLGPPIEPPFSSVPPAEPGKYRDIYRLDELVNQLLDVSVRVVDPPANTARLTTLGAAASHFTRLYANATKEHRRMLAGPIPKWWVQAGQPLVIVVADRRDTWIQLPAEARTILPDGHESPHLHQYFLRHGGGLRRIWVISHDAYSDGGNTRRLRIHLARLHTEHECLRLILNSLRARQLQVTPKSREAEGLQTYFEHVFDHIAHSEGEQPAELGPDPAMWARQSFSPLAKADARDIQTITKQLKLGATIQSKIARYTGELASVDSEDNDARREAVKRRNELRNAIMRDFDLVELEDLRQRLEITEEFLVDRKTAYVNALIAYVDRRGLLEALAGMCHELRSDRPEYL